MKTCSRCGVEKPADEFFNHKRTRDGLSPWCKECQRAANREWAAKNPEKRREYVKASYARNIEKRRAEQRRYRQQNAEAVRLSQREWEKRNPGYRNGIAARVRERNRREAFMAYGGFRCACCGETEPMFLTIDHVNNDGAAHRRAVGDRGGSSFFAWLRSHEFPAGFQVLCRNCNWGKHANGGICPHQGSEGSSTIPSGSTP